MKPENEKLETRLSEMVFDDQPSAAHRDQLQRKLTAAFDNKRSSGSASAGFQWRKIMRNTYTKFATGTVAAAAVIIAFCVTIGPWSNGSTAWAIENAVEAMNNVKTVHIKGRCEDSFTLMYKGKTKVDSQPNTFEIWARAAEETDESGDLRFEVSDGLTIVVRGNTSYIYPAHDNAFEIRDGKAVTLTPWIGGQLLENLEKMVEGFEITYGRDENTGRECAYVSICNGLNMSWRLGFDTETNLLVNMKQWPNSKWEGEPILFTEEIKYDVVIDDSQFEFAPPAGVVVVDMRISKEQKNALLNDPDNGMLVGNMLEILAAKQIVEEFWNAKIQGDEELAAKLYPIAGLPSGKRIFSRVKPVQVIRAKNVQIFDMTNREVVCDGIVRFENSGVQGWKMVVRFREIDGVKSCVITKLNGTYQVEDSE